MSIKLEIKRMIALLLLAAFAYALFQLRSNILDARSYSFMVWNLFLALVPYGVSCVMLIIGDFKKSNWRTFGLIALGVLWLLFFPNAPYLFTSYMLFARIFEFEGEIILFTLQPWYDFVLLTSFIWCGILSGLASLGIVHGIIEKHLGKITGWVAVVVVNFLSSWAIYLGRFNRLNSWYIFTNPRVLLPYIWLSGERVLFICLLGIFMVLVYIVVHFFIGREKA